jgi:hypothetical protein
MRCHDGRIWKMLEQLQACFGVDVITVVPNVVCIYGACTLGHNHQTSQAFTITITSSSAPISTPRAVTSHLDCGPSLLPSSTGHLFPRVPATSHEYLLLPTSTLLPPARTCYLLLPPRSRGLFKKKYLSQRILWEMDSTFTDSKPAMESRVRTIGNSN